jgi:hypothetical protein
MVWVKRLVVYKSIDPVEIIRSIPFTTGLNIIQGLSSDEADERFESGHGVGKTTVCRLIRYCLGEWSFGQKHVVEEVEHCFPTSYVGAVVEVDGTEWTILRSLSSRARSSAREGSELNDLIRADGSKRYEAFVERLSGVVMSDVPVGEALTSGQQLQWLHVLAMCSRDQETRYDRFWNWRDKRSESESPTFKKPTVDAGLCVRALAGLLDMEEPRLRTKLAELKVKQEETRAKIKEQRLVPSLRMARMRETLLNECGVGDADTAPVSGGGFLGLDAITDRRKDQIRDELDRIEVEIRKLDQEISFLAVSLQESQELAEQEEAARDVIAEGGAVLADTLEKQRAVKSVLEGLKYSLCKPGDVLYGQCRYVQDRLSRIDQTLRDTQQSTLSEISEREQTSARLSDQVQRRVPLLVERQRQLEDLNRQKNGFLEQRLRLNDLLRRIPGLVSALHDWNATHAGTKQHTALQALQSEEGNIHSEIETTKIALSQLLVAQGERINRLQAQFDGLVRMTLTPDFRGTVGVGKDGLHFRIMRGESLSGEAYETLAILLADVALLFEGGVAHARHPGFLLHDSPREADLNVRIYRRFLDMADVQMRREGQTGDVPFQYIVTTTTEPSERVKGTPVTRLTLSDGPGSLFGQQLEAPAASRPVPTLFDQEGDT